MYPTKKKGGVFLWLARYLMRRSRISSPSAWMIWDQTYRDGVDIRVEDVFAYADRTGQIPKTAAASSDDFLQVFKPYAQQGRDVVFLGISSEMSSTVQSARLAAQECTGSQIIVVDSRNLSTGIGLLVLYAAELAQAGASAREIEEAVLRRIPQVRASFLIDTLTYLHRGGRCSTLQMIGAAVMKLKPMIQVKDGVMLNTGKFRGSIGKALRQYVKTVLEQEEVDPKRVFITHPPMPGDEAQTIVEMVKAMNLFEEVHETSAGCVISCHCGPGTLGVLFFAKDA